MSVKSFFKEHSFIVMSCCLAASMVLFRKATPYFIGFWFISTIFAAFQNKNEPFGQNIKWTSIIASLFGIYLVYFLLSDFSRSASQAIEIKASFLVFPLGFFLRRKPITQKELSIILLFYQLACLASATFVSVRLLDAGVLSLGHLSANEFTFAVRTFSEDTLGVHPTYLSIFYLFSIYLTVSKNGYHQWIHRPILKNSLRTIHLLVTSTICLLLVAKAPLIGFIIAFGVVSTLKSWKKGLLLLASGILGLAALIFFVPSIGNRFKEITKTSEVTNEETSVNSMNIRSSIFSCSTEIIAENWVFGVGLDHVQSRLNSCYDNYKNEELSSKDYNTHNQYFDLLLSVGLIGLLSFLLLLVFPLGISNIISNTHLLFFKVFIGICFLSENILSRQHGVVFFIMINCIFISNYYWRKTNNETVTF